MNDEQRAKRDEKRAFMDFTQRNINRRTFGAVLNGRAYYFSPNCIRGYYVWSKWRQKFVRAFQETRILRRQ